MATGRTDQPEFTPMGSCCAEVQLTWPRKGKHTDQWSHHSLYGRAFPSKGSGDVSPEHPKCSPVTKPVPCRTFLLSEAAPCITSRLAQRENQPGKKESISHMEIGPYIGISAPRSHAAVNHPLLSPWEKCSQRQTWHMEISALKSNIISKLMTNKIYFCSGLV